MESGRTGRKAVIILSIFILFLLIGILIWKSVHGDKVVYTEKFSEGRLSSLLEETGVGTVDEADTFYVKRDEPASEKFVPGKYLLDIERQETDKVMSNTIDGEEYTRGKRDYDYLNLNIYNVNNPMQIKRINILELISTNCPGFQDSVFYYVSLQNDGALYVGFLLEDIPQKATDDVEIKWLFWNMETEETIVLDGEDAGITFIENGRTEEETEYLEKIEQADWESFYAQNGYRTEGQDRTFFNAEGLWAATGGVKVTVDCEVLPQENDILYTRFPELEKWKGAEGREAIIWVGGYPTVEEIMEMFEKQEL
ncbi:hypothetical protein [Clostridium sp. Marseille-P3244]|uniref:hypothetical protein n=1 Tax=Clostridium sp. Marseille-P3244 TaxID=1871020 RepID=UPI000930172F|nr:hypothetical protein [Clostridium sp. Marseille-P3244]